VSQGLLWLWHGDSSETQEGERSLLETGARGMVKVSRPSELSAGVVNFRMCELATVPL
jgi:hypothetical protein